MKKLTPSDPETHSPDITAENISRLRELFPELITEGAEGVSVNLDVLKQLVGDRTVTDAQEKYGLNWHGKRQARQIALTPSTGTLRPCPEESVDWETTQNLFLEGDNLEILKLLQKPYAGKVKLMYWDPPYNTGSDFVYPDNYQDNIKNYLKITGQIGEMGRLASNSEASGRYHTEWLNMMYPRLKLAKNLLSPMGIFTMSIDDHEVSNAISILDEIFGTECFVAAIHVHMSTVQGQKVRAAKSGNIVKNGEYILVYSKDGHKNIGISPLLDPSQYDPHYSIWLTSKGDKRFISPLTEAICKDEQIFKHLLAIGLVSDKSGIRKMINENLRTAYAASAQFRKWIHENSSNIARIHDSIELEDESLPNGSSINEGEAVTYRSSEREYLLTKSNGKIVQLIGISEKISTSDSFENEICVTTIRGDWWPGFYLDMGNVSKEGGVKYPSGKKPLRLIKQIVKFVTKDNDIIVDMFSGSGTTGHAVMSQNCSDGGKRRYILAQLPEPLDPSNKEQKDSVSFCDSLGKPRSIAELTKERLRRSAKSIREENPLFAGDLGFRVFKLASTNIREWEPDRENLEGSLEASVDHLKTDRTEQDILFELLLKLGLDLTVPIEEKTIGKHKLHAIGAGALFVCLSREIPKGEIEKIADGIISWHKDLNPAGETTIVFRDSAFADDVAKTNLTAILDQAGLSNVRSL